MNPSHRTMSPSSPADLLAIESVPWVQRRPAVSMHGLLERAASLHGDRPAFIHLPAGAIDTVPRVTTYRELLRQVRQAANLFHRLGCTPDRAIALMTPNSPLGQIALWAAETVAQACPMNGMLAPAHASGLLVAARAHALVVQGPGTGADVFERAMRSIAGTGVAHLLTIDGSADAASAARGKAGVPDASPTAIDFADALSREPGDRLVFERVLDADAPAALFHTGGTTGAPKLARHLQGNQIHTAWAGASYYGLQAEDRMLNGFPLFHVAGSLVYGASCFVVGATQVLLPPSGFRDAEFMRNLWYWVERLRVSTMACVPTTLVTMLQSPDTGHDIGSVRVFYTGGSPLPQELARAVEQRFSRPVRNIYGMTECAGLVSVDPCSMPREPGSAGMRLPYGEVRAVALDGQGRARPDAPCAPGATGVLMLRGPNVGPGYTDVARNDGVFIDGWLVTGDLGHVDADGRVFVTGRAKDVIIRGSHNIDPAMIEAAFDTHPAVAMCCAVGEPDVYAGELPVIFVVLRQGSSADPAGLLEHARPSIAERAAVPKAVYLVPELPLTPVGKIFKPSVRAWAACKAFEARLAPLADAGYECTVSADASQGAVRLTVTLARDAPDVALEEARRLLGGFALAHIVERTAD